MRKFLRTGSHGRMVTTLGALLFDKLTVTQVVITITVFYETRRLTTEFTTAPDPSTEPGQSSLHVQPHTLHLYDIF
jgi:hypothetical protein